MVICMIILVTGTFKVSMNTSDSFCDELGKLRRLIGTIFETKLDRFGDEIGQFQCLNRLVSVTKRRGLMTVLVRKC